MQLARHQLAGGGQQWSMRRNVVLWGRGRSFPRVSGSHLLLDYTTLCRSHSSNHDQLSAASSHSAYEDS